MEVISCSYPPNHACGGLLFRVGRTTVSDEDTANPNNDVARGMSETGNSSASATITITMYTGDAE